MDSVHSITKNAMMQTILIHDFWMYIALAEFLVLIALGVCFYRTRKSHLAKNVRRASILKEGNIDFANVINSSFKSKALYDVLKKKCHPDKFATNEVLFVKATEIFALLVRDKHDYAALCALKDRAEKELNIKI